MTDSMRFLDYEERSILPPPALAFHRRAIELGASAQGDEHSYGEHRLQRLTVYPAAKPRGDILVVVHGGRWSHGYKEEMALMAPPLNERGITVVSVGYRLLPDAPYPAGPKDCGEAVRWVRRNLERYGCNKDGLFIGGHSSGAHYASLLATNPTEAGIEDLAPFAGCLPISGLFEIRPDQMPGQVLFPGAAEERIYAAASPAAADLSKSPPFLIAWGSADIPPIPEQSMAMARGLAAAGVAVQTLILEGANHFGAGLMAGEANGTWVEAADAFMRSIRGLTA